MKYKPHLEAIANNSFAFHRPSTHPTCAEVDASRGRVTETTPGVSGVYGSVGPTGNRGANEDREDNAPPADTACHKRS